MIVYNVKTGKKTYEPDPELSGIDPSTEFAPSEQPGGALTLRNRVGDLEEALDMILSGATE